VDFSTEKAYRDICRWLQEQDVLPTAFFADSDVIAFGAIRAFNRFGFRVPEDISVIGFDDMPACEMVSPPLTSIRVMKVMMGSTAMEILHQRITEMDTPSATEQTGRFRIAISTDIKVRRTVAPPRSAVISKSGTVASS